MDSDLLAGLSELRKIKLKNKPAKKRCFDMPINTKKHPDKLTTIEFATLAHCAEGTIRNSRHTGILFGQEAPPYTKVGRKVLYRRSDIEAFLAQFSPQNNTTETIRDGLPNHELEKQPTRIALIEDLKKSLYILENAEN